MRTGIVNEEAVLVMKHGSIHAGKYLLSISKRVDKV
jgi:hypothetical protein